MYKECQVNWQPGSPQANGIYWFDAGFGSIILVAQVFNSETHVFGDHGSMPMSDAHRIRAKARHVLIPMPKENEWKAFDSSEALGDDTRVWLKQKDNIGFGLVRQSSHGMSGTIVWLKHPDSASVSGAWIRTNEGYGFSPVKIPN